MAIFFFYYIEGARHEEDLTDLNMSWSFGV